MHPRLLTKQRSVATASGTASLQGGTRPSLLGRQRSHRPTIIADMDNRLEARHKTRNPISRLAPIT